MSLEEKMRKVLFVCLGNICRSPTAEAIFRKKSAGDQKWHFDSAGTSSNHIGEKSDDRSIKHAAQRGYEMTHLARQVQIQDFHEFDLIFTMDQSNYNNLIHMAPPDHHQKIRMVTELCQKQHPGLVPDPYYGGPKDFELVIDLLEDAATAFFEKHR
jgi:protein-tyrosine phosphatase